MTLDEFRVSVKINAPCDQVWRRLVDWKSQGDWMALTKVNSNADDGGVSGVGTEIKAFTGIGRIGILDEMRVVTWEPPRFCAVDHYGKAIKGIGEFHLVQKSDYVTEFNWYEKIRAPRLLLALFKPGILIAVRFSLWRFARTFTSS